MTRKLNVQTPGEAPANPEDQAELLQQGEAPANDTPTDDDLDALRAKLRELEAENLKLKGDAAVAEAATEDLKNAEAAFERASASITRQDRERFRTMSADQVNPKKLLAAVLTKDGWVAPDQTGQKAKE